MAEKILVFAPHPGDETFGCGGTIAKALNEGYDVSVIVMTDGRYLFSEMLGVDSDPTPQEVMEMRKEETRKACKALGVKEENLIFLDFEDSKLQENLEEATEKTLRILKETQPVKVFYTYEKDVNPDHQAASRILSDSIKRTDLSVIKYQYSLTRKNSLIGPIMDKILNLFKHNMIKIDISRFLSLKEAALKEFKSETTIVCPTQDTPLEKVERFLTGQEMFFIQK